MRALRVGLSALDRVGSHAIPFRIRGVENSDRAAPTDQRCVLSDTLNQDKTKQNQLTKDAAISGHHIATNALGAAVGAIKAPDSTTLRTIT